MKKQDITKTTITIGVTKKQLESGEIVNTKIDGINLQEWIKKSPQEQNEFVESKINKDIEEVVTHDVID